MIGGLIPLCMFATLEGLSGCRHVPEKPEVIVRDPLPELQAWPDAPAATPPTLDCSCDSQPCPSCADPKPSDVF